MDSTHSMKFNGTNSPTDRKELFSSSSSDYEQGPRHPKLRKTPKSPFHHLRYPSIPSYTSFYQPVCSPLHYMYSDLLQQYELLLKKFECHEHRENREHFNSIYRKYHQSHISVCTFCSQRLQCSFCRHLITERKVSPTVKNRRKSFCECCPCLLGSSQECHQVHHSCNLQHLQHHSFCEKATQSYPYNPNRKDYLSSEPGEIPVRENCEVTKENKTEKPFQIENRSADKNIDEKLHETCYTSEKCTNHNLTDNIQHRSSETIQEGKKLLHDRGENSSERNKGQFLNQIGSVDKRASKLVNVSVNQGTTSKNCPQSTAYFLPM